MQENERLPILVASYYENKQKLDEYDKLAKKENAEIKSIMLDEKRDKYECGDFKVSCTVSERESMKEDVLVSLFTSIPGFVSVAEEYGIVKMKPVIDFDALERVLYDGRLSEDMIAELDKAREVKEVVTLRVTKKKQKEA